MTANKRINTHTHTQNKQKKNVSEEKHTFCTAFLRGLLLNKEARFRGNQRKTLWVGVEGSMEIGQDAGKWLI
jgi:hypothetical protein